MLIQSAFRVKYQAFVAGNLCLIIDNGEHVLARRVCADRIEMDVQMRRLQPELQRDHAIGIRHVDEDAFRAMPHSREVQPCVFVEVRWILDVPLRDDHRVPAH